MADLSNKTLALLLLAAIVTSIGGTMISINKLNSYGNPSGLLVANDTGTATFTIASNFSIVFTMDSVRFGSGSVQGGDCAMGTNSSPTNDVGGNCIGFNSTVNNANLTVENQGNTRANVSLNFSATAANFIGGTGPHLKYIVRNVTGDAGCAKIANGSTWKEVGSGAGNEVSYNGVYACRNMNFVDATDRFYIGLWLLVPQDAPVRANTLTIAAIGCSDSSC